MANNLYVGGLPYQTTREDLAKFFSTCGTVTSAKIIMDRATGRPKGFGFVEMSTDEEAKIAVDKLNGAMMGPRKIFVVSGRPQEKRVDGYAPKASFAPKPRFEAKPGFVERRSGKERRQVSGSKPAEGERRGPPAFEKKPFEKKLFEKKPFEKKSWEKKPGDKRPGDDKKPFHDRTASKPAEGGRSGTSAASFRRS